jgi:hypothetical protein
MLSTLKVLRETTTKSNPSEVARYRQEFERLSAMALDHRMTITMIESLLVVQSLWITAHILEPPMRRAVEHHASSCG